MEVLPTSFKVCYGVWLYTILISQIGLKQTIKVFKIPPIAALHNRAEAALDVGPTR